MEENVYLYYKKRKKGNKTMECVYVPAQKMLTLKLNDEIDESKTDKLRRKIDNEITRFLPRKVIFDFSDVSFMDSAGIGMLIGRYKVIKMLGGTLEIKNCNKQVYKVFELSGILKIIPIIEDEENLARFVELELKHEGYETDVELDGRAGLDAALNQDFDVILLDLMLPELNGIEVARRVREVKDTPIIIMTARDSVIDRVSGLDHGADDYIVKPFAIEELLARVRALLRRISIEGGNAKSHQTTVTYKDLTIEKENRVVRRGDEIINLTKREYELLLILMENINVVMSRKELLSKVWGYDSKVETNVVDVYIRYLRNKIDRPGEKSYIQTVRGTGYVIRS